MVRFPATPQAIVFDLDGVLFDTEALYRDALLAAADEVGIHLPLSLCQRMVGLHGHAARLLLREHVGDEVDLDAVWEGASARYHALFDTDLRLKPGVTRLLDTLDELGIPRAIATSSPHATAIHHLDAFGLRERFDALVASGDCERCKPYPDAYLRAARILNTPTARCLALEDSLAGVRSATAAGVPTIMVPDLQQPSAELRRLCASVAANLDEVNQWLRETAHGVATAPPAH
ncbi:HAD family phosphatase [Luteibacter sp. 3190]|uniref:HAD family hydrolase n=1 Tax=Luteibacter sp. 3190 TaxID=2817736 RepID=UPI00285731F3|nr:HAD family phosphatase [Luteibacter sp. 3190]MDR6936099.1 HAD superfamily hydrolase (TIGR01509 family) [Luteibacter sp. 3190]